MRQSIFGWGRSYLVRLSSTLSGPTRPPRPYDRKLSEADTRDDYLTTSARPLRPLAYGSASGNCRPVSGPLAADGLERPLPDRRYSRTRPNPDLEQAKLDGGFISLSSYSPYGLKNL